MERKKRRERNSSQALWCKLCALCLDHITRIVFFFISSLRSSHPRPFGYAVKARSGVSALIKEVHNELQMVTRIPSSLWIGFGVIQGRGSSRGLKLESSAWTFEHPGEVKSTIPIPRNTLTLWNLHYLSTSYTLKRVARLITPYDQSD